MPPLNSLKGVTKLQAIEMEEECLRQNFSEQTLVRENTDSVGGTSTSIPTGITRKQIVTVGILCYVNLINYMDRYTVAGLLYDIAGAYNLTESQQGLLQTAFILVYMVMAPVYGYLGDRFNRKLLMAFGVFLWSLTTLIGSFMTTYELFLIMRCLVGIGEASYSTIAPTLISDIFVSDTRSKMLALFYFAIPVGSGLGYIIGAEVADIAAEILPDDADVHAWRWGLRVTPIMGFVAVILILFVLQEPPRGQVEGGEHLKPTSFKSDLKHLFFNRSYVLSTIAFTCVTYVAGALAWWGPKYVELGVIVQDGHANVKQDNVSFVFGVIAMMAGLIGVPLGSFAGQKLRLRWPSADPIVCGTGLLLSIPLLIGSIFMTAVNSWIAFVVVFLGQVFLNLNWAVVSDIVLYIVIPTRRSSAEAFQILISHTFGDAGSPYIVGVVAEAFKPMINSSIHHNSTAEFPEYSTSFMTNSTDLGVQDVPNDKYVEFKALQYSLAICTIVELLAGAFFFLTAIYITRDKEKCDRTIAGDILEESSISGGETIPQPFLRFLRDEDRISF